MAENYLQFAESLRGLTSSEEAWLADRLTNHDVQLYDEELDDEEHSGEFDFEFFDDSSSGRCLKLFAVEAGDPEAVARLVQEFLRRFRPQASFGLSWCASCSKMRDGEFGGGAVFVTAERIEAWSSDQWLAERV
ncbi:MAG: hypothetical protein AB7O68_09365 [Pirellulales bacterium]